MVLYSRPLSHVMWQPGWEGVWERMDACKCVTASLCCPLQNYHDIIHWLYSNTKKEFNLKMPFKKMPWWSQNLPMIISFQNQERNSSIFRFRQAFSQSCFHAVYRRMSHTLLVLFLKWLLWIVTIGFMLLNVNMLNFFVYIVTFAIKN